MKERINFSDGYYFGDTGSAYFNGQLMKTMNGFGTYYWNNGDTFSGTIQNNLFVQGTHVVKGKWTYVGQFYNMSYHGSGRCTYPNGDIYDGQYACGSRSGKGRYTYGSGGYYDGDWVNGNRHGKGEMVYSDGTKYVGDFVDNARTGKGECWFVTDGNPCYYRGGWKNDFWFGSGEYYGNGFYYSGDFVDGKYDGNGTLNFLEDACDSDEYSLEDLMEYDFSKSYSIRYVGGFKNGYRSGTGMLTMLNTVLQSNFVKGEPGGNSVLMVNADGFRLAGVNPTFNTYEGMIMNGQFIGVVKLTDGRTGESRTVAPGEANEELESILSYMEDYLC